MGIAAFVSQYEHVRRRHRRIATSQQHDLVGVDAGLGVGRICRWRFSWQPSAASA